MSEGWTEVTLGELCDFVKGTSPTQKTLPGEYPLIVTAAEPRSSDSYQIEGEAVCIPMVSSTGHGHASLNRVHYATGKFAVANIIVACVVRDETMCVTRFLWLYLQARKDEILVPRMQGTANVSLSQRELAKVPVSLPPIAEQRRIVDLIATLDEAIEAAIKSQASIDDLWWSAASAMAVALKPLATEQLSDIAAVTGGLTKNKASQAEPGLVEVPYLRVANVHRRYLDLADVSTIRVTRTRLDQLRLSAGDVLMNEGGDKDKLGRGAIWNEEIDDCIHQNHVFRARILDSAFTPEFVSLWANSFGKQWFEIHGTQTTGIASISKTTLSKFPIPRAPLVQQRTWTGALGAIDAQIRDGSIYVETLRTLRTNVLAALLSGEHEIPTSYDEQLGVMAP